MTEILLTNENFDSHAQSNKFKKKIKEELLKLKNFNVDRTGSAYIKKNLFKEILKLPQYAK